MYIKNRIPKYIKQNVTELKVEMDNSTIIVTDFNPQILVMHGTKTKLMEDLNNTMKQLALTENYKTFYLIIADYIHILLKYT